MAASNTGSGVGVYRYPKSIIHETTDYLQIDVVEYKPISQNDQNTNKSTVSKLVSGAGSRKVNNGSKLLNTIILPIPSNIQDSNSAKYGDSSLNSIGAAALGGVKDIMESGKALTGGMQNGITAFGEAAGATISSVGGALGGLEGVQGFATRIAASKAVGIFGVNVTPDQILARTQGEILNPNLELLFNGPTLRSFRFSFKMTPRNQDEGIEIMNMIRCLKRRMAPKVKGTSISGTMMKTPDVFELRYRKGTGAHPFLNHFKQCFLESVNVNYTGESAYATYHDGTPVSIIMDLSFKEIEPIYDSDYDIESSGPLASGEDAFKTVKGVGGVGY